MRLTTLSRAAVLVLAFAFLAAPFPSFASHNDDDDDNYRSYRSGYSSTVRRAIDKLDDDPVEDLPIPVFGVKLASISPDFGDPRDGGSRTHQGQDILALEGSFVVSPTEAVVTRTGKGATEGNYVYTAGPGGETFAYMHLHHVASGVKAGTVLDAGDLIGFVGDTGNAKGGPPHLHFEVREGRKATDPYPRLTGAFTKSQIVSMLTDIIRVLKKELD
jgi:murein DD-endopeptidase MepM/ murein hydrolase activator NlpD